MGYKCPRCRASVIWSHSNSRPGSTSGVICGNNIKASRLDFKKGQMLFCSWSGTVVRLKNGNIEIYHTVDGNRLKLRKRL